MTCVCSIFPRTKRSCIDEFISDTFVVIVSSYNDEMTIFNAAHACFVLPL